MYGSLTDRIENDFTLHPPADPYIAAKMDELRAECKRLAHFIDDNVPDSREKSTAITKLEEVTFHAIAGVARNQERILEHARPAPDS